MPLRAGQRLREYGIDAIHACEAGLAAAPDTEVLRFARSEQRACVTLDHDFHAILAETGATSPSVLFLRIQQTSYVETARLIERLLREFSSQLDEGIALTATVRGVRFRRLPLR
jgi:predicted nuclease of predicted toxin-antitoxin system